MDESRLQFDDFWQRHIFRHAHKVELVLTTLINNFKIKVMSVELAANQKVLGALGLQDSVTGNPVTATFSNVQATSDTPAAFTASVDANNNIIVTGVAAGAGKVNISATASFTNSLNQPATANLSLSVDVTIDAVVVADNVVLVITWGAPQPQ